MSCLGTGASMGGVQGGMSRGAKAACPVCGRKIGMRPGRAGRLYPHSPKWPPAVTGTCDADGYTPVGTMGDERYWHCEDAAVVIDPEGLKLCARHAEEYWPDLIPGLLP